MKRTILTAVILLALSLSSFAADESRKAVISFLKGPAKIIKKGESAPVSAKLSMQLTAGDRIETGAGTRAEIKLEDGSTVRISENTSIVLDEMSSDKDTGRDKSAINVIVGRIWMNVKKSLGQESRIITPKVTAAVKGTTYRADVSPEGDTKVNVYDGTVAVSKPGSDPVLLSKLEMVTSKELTKSEFDEQSDEREDWVKWNKSRDKLRVMIVAKEMKNKELASVPVSESTLIELFNNNYLFSVVDQAQVANIRQSERLKAAMKGDAASAAAAGLEFGADIAIVVDTTTGIFSDKDMLAGMVSASTNISGKIYRTDDAIVISAGNQPSRKVDITEDSAATAAIKDAATKLGQKFIGDIIKKWKEEARKGGVFTVTCSNISDYNKAKELEKALAGINGAKNVTQYYFTAKRALYTVQFTGDSGTLAGEAGSLTLGGKNVEVVGVTAYRIELEAK